MISSRSPVLKLKSHESYKMQAFNFTFQRISYSVPYDYIISLVVIRVFECVLFHGNYSDAKNRLIDKWSFQLRGFQHTFSRCLFKNRTVLCLSPCIYIYTVQFEYAQSICRPSKQSIKWLVWIDQLHIFFLLFWKQPSASLHKKFLLTMLPSSLSKTKIRWKNPPLVDVNIVLV